MSDDGNTSASIRTGEAILRRDIVITFGNQLASPRLAEMMLTSQRVIWTRPGTTRTYDALTWTIGIFLSTRSMRPPMGKPIAIELADITKIWRWQPAFARPAWLEVGKGAGMSFWLMAPGRYSNVADPQAMGAHLEAIETAWKTARSRTTPHESQP